MSTLKSLVLVAVASALAIPPAAAGEMLLSAFAARLLLGFQT